MADPRFSIIPAGAVLDKRLHARDLQVLCLLGRHTDKKGWCQRSQVKMAKELGCARSTVQGSIDRLVEAGWLQKRAEKKPGEKGDRDAPYEFRVVLDVQDDPLDVVDTPADQSAPLPTLDRHPLPTHGSAPKNDPFRTNPPTPRSKSGGGSGDGELVAISETDPLIPELEKLRGRPFIFGRSGKVTVKASEIEQASKAQLTA